MENRTETGTEVFREKPFSYDVSARDEPSPLDRFVLAGSINRAYRLLVAANENLVRATYALEDYTGRKKRENAEVLLDAKTARIADIYLEGILDDERYRSFLKEKTKAEISFYETRMEVERLKLLVRLADAASEAETSD